MSTNILKHVLLTNVLLMTGCGSTSPVHGEHYHRVEYRRLGKNNPVETPYVEHVDREGNPVPYDANVEHAEQPDGT